MGGSEDPGSQKIVHRLKLIVLLRMCLRNVRTDRKFWLIVVSDINQRDNGEG